MIPVVAIVGRPNVGKSTLFNAIARRNVAIIDDQPGVTRDRNYLDVTREGRSFTLVDTGGFDPGIDDGMSELVRQQARFAVEEADLVVFVMDVRQGLLPGDEEIARILQQARKPIIYAINKVEGREAEEGLYDFYRLGVDALVAVSAKHRENLSEIIYAIVDHLPPATAEPSRADEIVTSIVGRPNVGKSSIVNRLTGQERLVVSEVAGTTRDPVDTVVRYNGRKLRFIDTAGLRRKSRIGYTLEKYTAYQSLRSISRSQVSVLVIDATAGITAQDAKIASQIHERHRAPVIIANKWDLVAKDDKTHDAFVRQLRQTLNFIDYAPVLVVSAKTGVRVRQLLEVIADSGTRYHNRISTADLNRALEQIIDRKPPPRGPGRATKIFYATQVAAAPPVIKIFTNYPKSFTPAYQRYLERTLRDHFAFDGIPLCLQIVQRHGRSS